MPTIRHLAQANEQTLLKLWEGLGYYSRVRNLQTAQVVVQNYGSQLPASFEELKQLPGIGDDTAGAIASIAFQLPVPAVDGNVLRVTTRLTVDDRDITKPAVKKDYFQRISEILQPLARSGDFNQALMDLVPPFVCQMDCQSVTSVRFPIYAALFWKIEPWIFQSNRKKSPARLKSAPYFFW